jgi:hypothetical protein
MNQPAPTISALLSVQDAVFPAHPFSGVLAIAREQDWRWQDMFPAFAEHHDNRISYAQAREGLLQARHRGGADLGLRSGTRKALPQLGQMATGMRAQETLAQALQFGLDYQLIAGSMVHLQLEAGRNNRHCLPCLYSTMRNCRIFWKSIIWSPPSMRRANCAAAAFRW